MWQSETPIDNQQCDTTCVGRSVVESWPRLQKLKRFWILTISWKEQWQKLTMLTCWTICKIQKGVFLPQTWPTSPPSTQSAVLARPGSRRAVSWCYPCGLPSCSSSIWTKRLTTCRRASSRQTRSWRRWKKWARSTGLKRYNGCKTWGSWSTRSNVEGGPPHLPLDQSLGRFRLSSSPSSSTPPNPSSPPPPPPPRLQSRRQLTRRTMVGTETGRLHCGLSWVFLQETQDVKGHHPTNQISAQNEKSDFSRIIRNISTNVSKVFPATAESI